MVACNVVHVITVGLLMIILWHAPQALWAILAVLVLHGGARSFFHTAGQAILPHLMPRAQFANAVAYSSSRSEEHTSELQSLMRISYAVFCLKTQNKPTSGSHSLTLLSS